MIYIPENKNIPQSSQRIELKIALDVPPPLIVWRTITIPSKASLLGLHQVIQIIMQWKDQHLHEFVIHGKSYSTGSALDEFDSEDEATTFLYDLSLQVNDSFAYVYDFGDDWRLLIKVKNIFDENHHQNISHCIAGEGSSPPENCGGPWGFEKIMSSSDTNDILGEVSDSPSPFNMAYINQKLNKLILFDE